MADGRVIREKGPDLGTGNAWAAVILRLCAILIVTAELGPGLGPVVPLTVAGCSFVMMVLLRERILALGHSFWILAFPAFMILSFLWSSNPGIVLYYGLQLAITVFASFLIVASLRLRQFVTVLFVASAIICIASYINGATAPSTIEPVIVGFTGSKNGMASCANLCLISGLTILFDGRQDWRWRVASVAMTPFTIYIIAFSYAASIVILSIVMPLCMITLSIVSRLPLQARLMAVVAILMLLLAGKIFSKEIEEYIFHTFKKDPTLTGRTYLWSVAETWIRERPVLGWGYRAKWMSESVDVIGMLRSQEIPDVKTFSIHQTYLDAWVDGGIIGLVLLSITLAAGTAKAAWNAIYDRDITKIFAATFLIGMVIRGFGESTMGPFYPYTTIVFALIVYATRSEAVSVRVSRTALREARI